MADNAVPTLAPEKNAPKVLDSLPAQPRAATTNTEKEALFNSLATSGVDEEESSQSSSLKAFLTGLLWFGYATAIVVALVLVWSAAKGLFMPLPR